jgi:hypothetical protein
MPVRRRYFVVVSERVPQLVNGSEAFSHQHFFYLRWFDHGVTLRLRFVLQPGNGMPRVQIGLNSQRPHPSRAVNYNNVPRRTITATLK